MAKKFNPGDKVFAKVRGYPPWPARVVGLADATVNKMKYHVSFYGTGETAVCKVEDLFAYLDNKEKYGKPLKRKGFNEALAEVEQILSGAVTEKIPSATGDTAEGKTTAATPTPSGGGGEDADSDHEFNLIIDENPQRTTPANKQSRTASTEEKKKVAKRKRESEASEETEAKRAKRSSIAASRKSTDAAKSIDSAVPNTPANVSALNSGAATPQSPPKPEIISRSGRKIKPKKFLDEEEGAGGIPEANGSPKAGTPKPTIDGEGKQTPVRSSKRSVSKVNAMEGVAVQDDQQSEEQEGAGEKDGSKTKGGTDGAEETEEGQHAYPNPYKGVVLMAKTLSGHIVEIKVDQDRPKSFKNEKARVMWDEAVYRNALKLKDQIEKGEFIPDDIKRDLDRKAQMKEEEKSILKKDRVLERKKSKLKWLKVESRMVELDALVKSNLSLTKADPERCLTHLDEISGLAIDPLMLKKHPQVMETIKKLRRYIGNTSEWNYDEDQKSKFAKMASQIRDKADHIYNRFKAMFTVPEGKTFWQVFADHVSLFKQQTSHLSQEKLYSLTVDPNVSKRNTDSASSEEEPAESRKSREEGAADSEEGEEENRAPDVKKNRDDARRR